MSWIESNVWKLGSAVHVKQSIFVWKNVESNEIQ